MGTPFRDLWETVSAAWKRGTWTGFWPAMAEDLVRALRRGRVPAGPRQGRLAASCWRLPGLHAPGRLADLAYRRPTTGCAGKGSTTPQTADGHRVRHPYAGGARLPRRPDLRRARHVALGVAPQRRRASRWTKQSSSCSPPVRGARVSPSTAHPAGGRRRVRRAPDPTLARAGHVAPYTPVLLAIIEGLASPGHPRACWPTSPTTSCGSTPSGFARRSAARPPCGRRCMGWRR